MSVQMLILIAFISLLILYSLLIFYYWRSWKAIPGYQCKTPQQLSSISVIIPARNEENNIGNLLDAITKQTLTQSLFEVIVIDDHSTDKTAAIAKQYPGVSVVSLDDSPINSYKKKAIEKGIEIARGELIVTTDADCIPPPAWLGTIAAFHAETGAGFIVSPVDIANGRAIVEHFQAIDFMVLQGITAGSVFTHFHAMCNGANLAYEKKLFIEVGGFSGIDHIASGDDMLLMQKVATKCPGKIRYLKSEEAIVKTLPAPTWSAFFNQRIRWASKATVFEGKKIFLVLLLVYAFNLSFLVVFAAAIFNSSYWPVLIGGLIVKTLVELPFVISLSAFFRKQSAIIPFILFQPVHILYIIISGLFGQFGQYEWKGRKVK
ncbi:MAG: glycosyltransferase [Chitinophagaceae bacterium]|nr:MAG: glycosyltransferase [Chitinophagaceae bacterium]